MMKKYIQPTTELVRVKTTPLMENSVPVGEEDLPGGGAWAPRFDGLDDEPEEKNSIWE